MEKVQLGEVWRIGQPHFLQSTTLFVPASKIIGCRFSIFCIGFIFIHNFVIHCFTTMDIVCFHYILFTLKVTEPVLWSIWYDWCIDVSCLTCCDLEGVMSVSCTLSPVCHLELSSFMLQADSWSPHMYDADSWRHWLIITPLCVYGFSASRVVKARPTVGTCLALTGQYVSHWPFFAFKMLSCP